MPGHFARTCTFHRAEKSKSNQVRGKHRIQEYSQQKQHLKELPFYNVRNSALRNLMDYSAVLKHELAQTKQSLKDSQDNFLGLIVQFNEMQKELNSNRLKMHAIQENSREEIKQLQTKLDASKEINKMASEEIQALIQKNHHQLHISQDQEEDISDLNIRITDLEYSLSEQQHIIDDLRDDIYRQDQTIQHQMEEIENFYYHQSPNHTVILSCLSPFKIPMDFLSCTALSNLKRQRGRFKTDNLVFFHSIERM